MASGEHYVLTLKGKNTKTNEVVDNVFVYEQTDGPGGAGALLAAFGSDVYGAIVNILSEFWEPVIIEAYCLEDLTDYDTLSTAVEGQRTGVMAEEFVVAAFRYVRTSRAFNDGRKAFGPLARADVEDGLPTSTLNTLLAALAAALSGTIDEPLTVSTWAPVIWRRPGTYAGGPVAYPGIFNDVDTVTFARISTQNTRKRGRGD